MKIKRANLNAVIAGALALIVVLEIGYISLTHPWRKDFSQRGFYKLSERTEEILQDLAGELKVLVIFDDDHPYFHDVENLLDEYQSRLPRQITVEWVNPRSDLEIMEELRLKYELDLDQDSVVVFDLNDGAGIRVVREVDLFEIEYNEETREYVDKAFRGEQAFSSALYSLINGDNPTVCFLAGHGEASINSDDEANGLSQIRDIAARSNQDLVEVRLKAGQMIDPEHVSALVIAGPTQELEPYECEAIERYLENGGRLLVMLDALYETGLEPMLQRWQIYVTNDLVVDPDFTTSEGRDLIVLSPNLNSSHPITKAMREKELNLRFQLPRSVGMIMDEKSTREVELLFTASNHAYTKNLQSGASVDLMTKNPEDREGLWCIGASVQQGGGEVPLSKMVVIGDSNFIRNGFLAGGNPDLFVGAMDWLLDRKVMVASKTMEEVHLTLSRGQIGKLIWFSVLGIPCAAVIPGFIVWYRRRK